MQFLAIYGTKAEAIFPLWTLRPSWFSWPSLRRGGGGGGEKEGKKDKVEEKKGSGRKVGTGVAGNSPGTSVPQSLAGRGRRGHRVISRDDASDGGTCEFSTSRAPISQHPQHPLGLGSNHRGGCSWRKAFSVLTHFGLFGKVFQPLVFFEKTAQ